MDGEQKLILRIARALPSAVGVSPAAVKARSGVVLGIGDDAAIFSSGTPGRGKEWVVTTDAFLEGVHFLADLHPADSVGYKALARAASDLAAMGARPRAFFLTLALPSERTGAWLDAFLRGMRRAARELGLVLAGGDTSRFDSITMALTVAGEIATGKGVRRSGARPGDILYVSGKLGRAQLGLELLRKLPRRIRASLARGGTLPESLRHLLKPHLYPSGRLELGAWLAAHGVASAMMDLSDGLSTDLPRLCAASGMAARIWANRIPRVEIPAGKISGISTARLDPMRMALDGGDDYELLFAVPPQRVRRLRRAPGFSALSAIGEIERPIDARPRVLLVDSGGRARPLHAGGWDSFRRE